MRRLLTLLFLVMCAELLPAQAAPKLDQGQRSAAFDRLDRTARSLIATLTCAIGTSQARARGAFGPVDSLGRMGMCIRRDGRMKGAFLGADTTFAAALSLRVVDLRTMQRDSTPVDTLAVLAEARAARNGVLQGTEAFEKADRQYAPFSFRTDGDSIEVWLLPTSMLMGPSPATLGGERGFVYAPDGRTMVREINAFDRYRPFAMPDTGRVDIVSQEDDLPLVSELLVLNVLHRQGRAATLTTGTYTAQLLGPEPNSMWSMVQVRK